MWDTSEPISIRRSLAEAFPRPVPPTTAPSRRSTYCKGKEPARTLIVERRFDGQQHPPRQRPQRSSLSPPPSPDVDRRLATRWRTHGLPPQVGTVTVDTPPSASPRSAVPAGTTSAPAGGTTGATRCPSQALRLQVVAARASRSPSPRPRRRLARPAAPQPPPPAPLSLTAYQQNVRPPRPGGAGTDVRGDRPGRSPRSPSSGTAPPPPAAVAAVPWQPCRPPPSPAPADRGVSLSPSARILPVPLALWWERRGF